MRHLTTTATVVGVALALTACAAPATTSPAPGADGPTRAAPAPPVASGAPTDEPSLAGPSDVVAAASWQPGVWRAPPPRATPAAVWIPEIGVSAPLGPLGLDENQELEVPTDYDHAGWYVGSPRPGEPGPAVVAGHVDSRSGPAVFHRLHELQPGDLAHLVYDDGFVVAFEVYEREQYAKDAFPTERVYGNTDAPEVRLITCGGSFDRSTGHYRDNVVVYGKIHATWQYDGAAGER